MARIPGIVLRGGHPRLRARLEAFGRASATRTEVTTAVADILASIRDEGDAAVARLAARFDGARLRPRGFRVPAGELAAAWRSLPAEDRRAMRAAHAAVLAFNRRTLPKSWTARNPHGATTGERFHPIRRCGLYIPGGQVPLVSSVLMSAPLARLAGVPEIAAFTPGSGPEGRVAPALLAAFHLCGVTEVYRIGGVQAIGAMAFGTRSIPAVDKIFGPGNAYVVEAKRQVFGTVGVDLLPGPSEVMVIADATAHPDFIAADLLAQAEHGSGREKIYLVTTSEKPAGDVGAAIAAQLATLSRAAQIRSVLKAGLLTVIARSLDEAVDVANLTAPEHLELHVDDAEIPGLLRRITTAGAILIGARTPTVLGDFTAGPSHTLPTGGTGRFFSGLRVGDFMRRTSIVRYDGASLRLAAPVVRAFSRMEHLDAHGRSLEIRLEDKD